jgi:pimeloyl-ACP methyl ester carboxylesterase
MIARLTRILLLVQIVAAGAIFYAIVGPTPTLARMLLVAMCSIGCVVLLRMLLNANNFFIAWLYRGKSDARRKLKWHHACKMFFEEFTSSMLTSSWYMPFHAFQWKGACHSIMTPVLLIHGYGCNSGYWSKMSVAFDQAGIMYGAVNLEPVFGAIDNYVSIIDDAIKTLCAASGRKQVIIVAHSMGGLVARAYLCKYGYAHTVKIITLGTPHHGTGLAHFGLGQNSRQMRWHGTAEKGTPNTWLQQLAGKENKKNYAMFVSIYSVHDNIIAPQNSSFLPGARNIAFHGIGHVALGMNPKIIALVVREILDTTGTVHQTMRPTDL